MNFCSQFLRYRIIALLLVLMGVLLALPAFAASAPTVRVLLLEKAAAVRVKGSMEIRGYRSPQPFTGEKVYTADDLNVTLTIIAQSGFLAVNGKPYRGEIVVKPTSEGLLVVNRLSIEEYLYGVLPGEVDPEWPMEALKAQAVAARSYALAQMRWRISQDYDVYSDQRSQVYYGVNREHTRTTGAVTATRGLVTRYEGEVIQANFFASGGGTTANSEDVWGMTLPYLRSVSDFDQGSPHFSWKTELAVEDVQARLESGGICVGQLVDIVSVERDSTNRVKTIKIIGDRSEEILTGSAFRFLLGLKSTNFAIVHSNNNGGDTGSGESTSEPGVHTQIGTVLDGQAAANLAEAEAMQTVETRPIGDLINSIIAQSEETECQTGTQNTASTSLSQLIADIFSYFATLPGPLVGSVEVTGSGWGHGVGLSQWGAKQMAAQGASYDQILAHYYQGIEIFQQYQ